MKSLIIILALCGQLSAAPTNSPINNPTTGVSLLPLLALGGCAVGLLGWKIHLKADQKQAGLAITKEF